MRKTVSFWIWGEALEESLREFQLKELKMLKALAEQLESAGVKFYLIGGSSIGALRHKGFIPWDDDIDICMLRQDYNRFVKLWIKSQNTDFIIQNKTTDNCFDQSFTKIRKNNTTFLQSDEYAGLYHNGIFIDVLPLDRIPKAAFKKALFKWNLMNYLLFTREHVDSKSNVLVRFVSSIILGDSNPKRRNAKRCKYLKKITQYNSNTTLNLVSANTLDGLRHEMPSDLPSCYKRIKFENREYMCYDNCTGLLTAWYGDYTVLPPEENRVWKHKPIIVDFSHNIDELGSRDD